MGAMKNSRIENEEILWQDTCAHPETLLVSLIFIVLKK